MIVIDNENNIKKRLDVFLVEYFEKYQRSKISSLIEEGYVFVNEKVQKPSYKTKLNDKITFKEDFETFLNPSDELIPLDFKLDIIYEDEDLIVLNKPKDILCHPTKHEHQKTLVNALLSYCPDTLSSIGGLERQGIVHRLDKNTAGLMLIAKNDSAHVNLSKQIGEKTAIRRYLAIALGEFKEKKGIIDKPLVHYLKDNRAKLKYILITLRAHLSSINHPIFGDSLYGAGGLMRNEFYNLKTQEQLLQSYFLSFNHPKTNERMEFCLKEEAFSKDFIKVLNFLRSKNATDN